MITRTGDGKRDRLKQIHKRSSDERYLDIIGILGDEYNLRILEAARKEPIAVERMVRELNIPVISCYRRVKELMEHGFLEANIIPDEERQKRKKVFRSNLESYRIRFAKGQILTEIRYVNKDAPEIIGSTPTFSTLGH